MSRLATWTNVAPLTYQTAAQQTVPLRKKELKKTLLAIDPQLNLKFKHQPKHQPKHQ